LLSSTEGLAALVAAGALRSPKHLPEQATEVSVLADWHFGSDKVDEIGNASPGDGDDTFDEE
jgi:hypothetical protein